MNIRYRISILLYRTIKFVFKKTGLHGGTSFPGMIAKKICPFLIERLAKNVITVIVIGTNGKTTTARMITDMIKAAGYSVCSNREGANLENGIVSAYLENMTLRGEPINEYAIIECDEQCFPQILLQTSPKAVVLTNIFPDQLYRFGEKSNIVSMFAKSIKTSSDTIICVNQDNQDAVKTVEYAENTVVRFGVENGLVKVDDQLLKIELSLGGQFNLYNAAAACACCKVLGFLNEETIYSLSKVTPAFGRMESVSYKGHTVTFHLVKNTVSLNEAITYLKETGNKCSCIIGINNNDCDDKSLEWFKKSSASENMNIFSNVYLTGAFKSELSEYLGGKYQTITKKDILPVIADGNDDFVLILNYSCMMEVRRIFYLKGIIKKIWI